MQECPFDNHKCSILIDYQVAQIALQEAAELCSSNWKEIDYLLDRVKLLESLLKENGIIIPD